MGATGHRFYSNISLPLTKGEIREILDNTIDNTGQSLSDKLLIECQPRSIGDISKELYTLTGGHPGSLVAGLQRAAPLDELPTDQVDLIMHNVFQALGIWRHEIYEYIFCMRDRTDFEITSELFHCMVTRIHGGLGVNSRKTGIVLMPRVYEYLDRYFNEMKWALYSA
jgi:hypothetical protein